MKWLFLHLFLIALGVLSFVILFTVDIDGIYGFILATIGLLFIGLGLTIRGIIAFFLNVL